MKSYFNVPDNINSSNRHLGTEKNTRGGRPENRAKKQHRIKKLKYENDKRVMRMWEESINAMMDKIAYLQEINYYLEIEEQQRIIDIENEKEEQRKQVEIQKEQAIINHNNMIDHYSYQLSLLPEYREYIKLLNEENDKILAQKEFIQEQLALEKSIEIKKLYQNYFDTIKQKNIENEEKILQLEIINNNKVKMQRYIDNRNQFLIRSRDIYNKSIEIIQNITKTKLEKEEAINNWNYNLNMFNDYIAQNKLHYENQQIAAKKEEEIRNHNIKLQTVSDYIKDLENTIKLEYIEFNTIIDDNINNDFENHYDIKRDNSLYIKYFSDAINNLKKYTDSNKEQIKKYKLIQEQKEKALLKKKNQYLNIITNEIKKFKSNYIENVKRNKIIREQKLALQKKEEEHYKKKMVEEQLEQSKRIKHYADMIEKFHIEKNEYIELEKKQLLIAKKKAALDKQQSEKNAFFLAEKRKQIERLNIINETLTINRKKLIEEEKIKYEKYIKSIEEEKQAQLLKDKEIHESIKLKKDKQNAMILRINNIQKNINNEIIKKEQKILDDKIINEKSQHLKSIYKSQMQDINDFNIRKEQLELEKHKEELRQLELMEYNKKKHAAEQQYYYERLLTNNKEQFIEFKQQQEELERQQQLELEKRIQEEEEMIIIDNVNYAIESIFDKVNTKINEIEYNNKITFYNEQINLQKEKYLSYHKEIQYNKKKQEEEELEKQKQREELALLEEQKYKTEFMLHINNALSQIDVNNQIRDEFIKNHNSELERIRIEKQLAEEEEAKKLKAENEMKTKLLKQYYSDQINIQINSINEYKKNIADYNESIIQIEKQKQLEDEANAIKIKNQVLDFYEKDRKMIFNRMNQYRMDIEKRNNDKKKWEEEMIKKQQQETLDEEMKIKQLYEEKLKYYDETIKKNDELFNARIKEEERIQKEFDDKQKLLELENKLRIEKEKEVLIGIFNSNIRNINLIKAKQEEEKIIIENQQKELEKERIEMERVEAENTRIQQEKIKKRYEYIINDMTSSAVKEKEELEKEHIRLEKERVEMERIQAEKTRIYQEEIKKRYESIINDIANSKLEEKKIQEKLEEENRLINIENEILIKKQMDNAVSIYESQLDKLNKEQEKLKKAEKDRLIELENKRKLEEEQNAIDAIETKERNKIKYEKYISEYNDYIHEHNKLIEEDKQRQLLLEKELEIQYEKKVQERELENKIKHEEQLKKMNEALDHYKNKIIINKEEQERLHKEEQAKIQKLEEENIKKNEEIRNANIEKYSKKLEAFHEQQIIYTENISNNIIKEKNDSHNAYIKSIEEDIRNKIQDERSNKIYLSKIDKTVNYINDLNNSKSNTDYLVQLNEQYNNSDVITDDVVEINDDDIIKVGDTILSYDHFALYNTYNFNVVPKFIFQTWPTKNLPKNMQWVVNQIKKTHPKFEHFIYDDNDCRQFIKSHFGMEVLWAFDRLKPGAYKADLWRYCIMYIKGGIYLDIKMCPVNGFRFDYILKNDWYCNDVGLIKGIWQGILVSRPKNPLYKYLIETILDNVKNEFYGSNSLEISGPNMMYNLIKKLRITIPTPFDIQKFVNTKTTTILDRRYKVGICLKDDVCLLEYDEYRDECLRTGIHYDKAWKNRDVYDKDILLSNYISATE